VSLYLLEWCPGGSVPSSVYSLSYPASVRNCKKINYTI
jgi:hypothetical protein